MLYMMFVQAEALKCMGHAGLHHLRPARDPGSPGALQRETRVNQQGSQGAEMHMADMCIYRKKEEEQNMSSEEVLRKKSAPALTCSS